MNITHSHLLSMQLLQYCKYKVAILCPNKHHCAPKKHADFMNTKSCICLYY